ncbi:MAG: HAD-IC family P-type ATPase, partial [Nitrospiraceae bacterium]
MILKGTMDQAERHEVKQSVTWYRKDLSDVYGLLGSSEKGISSAEAAERLGKYGLNELEETKKKTLFMMFLDQFKDFMIVVLIAAAVISGVIGELVDTIAIVVIVVLNAVIGFVQEYRAEQAVKALKEMAAPAALALRDGSAVTIPAGELVPGDVVLLEAGGIVPADIRLIESARLKIEEAALTGESVPVEKSVAAIDEGPVPLGDRTNMAYKGTVASYGRGSGVVVATGMDTELGRIATMLQEEDEVKTPLQKRLARFGQRLGIVVIAICAIVFVTGLMRGEAALLMFLTAVSLAVAAIPEALPAVVTISLAIGAKKMVSQNALVRKLPAVETLGSVTYVCSDKTGTLTLNKMNVEELFADGKIARVEELKRGSIRNSDSDSALPHFPASELLRAMALNNDAVTDREGKVMGDPTEVALFECAHRLGMKKADAAKDFPRIAEIPFDSDRKCMTTFHRTPGGGVIAFSKGALETLLKNSSFDLSGGEAREMTGAMRAEIEEAGERIAGDGLRTLAFAFRKWDSLPEDMTHGHVERGLTFIGLAGLMDPPREEAKESVSICKTAGIKPVMITGDHPRTAMNIARRLGIISDGGGVMTGQELERLSLEEFEEKVEKVQ